MKKLLIILIILIAQKSFGQFITPVLFFQDYIAIPAFDPLNKNSNFTLSNHNLTANCPEVGGLNGIVRSTTSHGGTDLVYCEIKANNTVTTGQDVGICNSTEVMTQTIGATANSYGYVTFSSGGCSYHSASTTCSYTNIVAINIISITYNGVTNTATFYLNGILQFAFSGLTATQWYICVGNYAATAITTNYTANFDGVAGGAWSASTSTLRSTLSGAGFVSWAGTSL